MSHPPFHKRAGHPVMGCKCPECLQRDAAFSQLMACMIDTRDRDFDPLRDQPSQLAQGIRQSARQPGRYTATKDYHKGQLQACLIALDLASRQARRELPKLSSLFVDIETEVADIRKRIDQLLSTQTEQAEPDQLRGTLT